MHIISLQVLVLPERSEPEPGEKGESRSMSTGEPELVFMDLRIKGSIGKVLFYSKRPEE